MKYLRNIAVFVFPALVAVSCADSRKPNYQYMPNMYESQGYDTYYEYEAFEGGQSALTPVEGTIPRGWLPYDYEDSTEGMDQARAELKNPLPRTEENLTAGAELYSIYCAVCHGDKGDGNGILFQREKFLGIPGYDDPGRDITEGSIYHVIMYGLNSMGSYASQTDEEERWQITMYVEDLKADLEGTPHKPMAGEVELLEATDIETDTISIDLDNIGSRLKDNNIQ